jgi:ElaB/YqjD/DUF883 family membrane-anchored ribosome-binding protein
VKWATGARNDLHHDDAARVAYGLWVSTEEYAMSQAPTARLMDDLKRVVADAEALLAHATDGAIDGVDSSTQDLRRKLLARLREAQDKLGDLQEQARAAGKVADRYVHDNPWSSIGAAAAVGLLVGVLLGRR